VTAHKRTEITVETDRVLIIRRHRSIRARCTVCGCEVDMVGQGEAEVLTGISAQALSDGIVARKCHVYEGGDGALRICLESLLKSK